MSLNLRYDVFGAETLGDAKFEGKYEFPEVPGVRIDALPTRIVPFDRIGSDLKPNDWLPFYVHDKRFHRFLERRDLYLSRLNDVAGFIGADNSMYRDLPLAEQIHSCYLNRAIDYYLLSKGKKVIPNVSWGDWRTYDFCCDGVPHNSTVAMSTYGCSLTRTDKCKFEDAFTFCVNLLHPYNVVLHGSIWESLAEVAKTHNVTIIPIRPWRDNVVKKEKL